MLFKLKKKSTSDCIRKQYGFKLINAKLWVILCKQTDSEKVVRLERSLKYSCANLFSVVFNFFIDKIILKVSNYLINFSKNVFIILRPYLLGAKTNERFWFIGWLIFYWFLNLIVSVYRYIQKIILVKAMYHIDSLCRMLSIIQVTMFYYKNFVKILLWCFPRQAKQLKAVVGSF